MITFTFYQKLLLFVFATILIFAASQSIQAKKCLDGALAQNSGPSPSTSSKKPDEMKLDEMKKQIDQFSTAISSFKSLFNRIEARKKIAYGAISKDDMTRLDGVVSKISKFTPDPELQRGHKALKSAFHWQRQYLISTNPEHQKTYLEKGKSQMNIALAELSKYESKYEKEKKALEALLTPPPKAKDGKELAAWKNQLDTYDGAILSFLNLFFQITAYKSLNVGAVPDAEFKQLDEIVSTIDKMTPDSQLQRGHEALESAFHWLRQYLISTDPAHQKEYLEKGQEQMGVVHEELDKFRTLYGQNKRNLAANPSPTATPLISATPSVTLTPSATETPSPTLTRAFTLSFEQRLADCKSVQEKYEVALSSFSEIFDKIVEYKSKHYGAVPREEMQELREVEEAIDSMVPDPQLQRCHVSMLSGFHLLKQYLILVDPAHQKSFFDKGQAQLQVARYELERYKGSFKK